MDNPPSFLPLIPILIFVPLWISTVIHSYSFFAKPSSKWRFTITNLFWFLFDTSDYLGYRWYYKLQSTIQSILFVWFSIKSYPIYVVLKSFAPHSVYLIIGNDFLCICHHKISCRYRFYYRWLWCFGCFLLFS